MTFVILVAAAFRFYRLGAVPPGFQFDEAYNALDAVRVLEGKLRLFFPANGGREPLYTYWQAIWVWLLGATPFAFRWASAVAGLAAVPLTYALVRQLFPAEGGRLAALSALLMAISFWHIHFSRYGIRVILLPTLELLAFYFFWRMADGGWPMADGRWRMADGRWPMADGRWKLSICYLPSAICHWLSAIRYLPAMMAGAFLAAGVYAHPAGRMVPFILAVAVGYRIFEHRSRVLADIRALLVAGLVALVLFLPLGAYFWHHPNDFAGHPGAVSVFDQRVHAGDLPRALALNVLRVAGMFTVQGDAAWIHNLPGRPVFDPVMAIAFVVGVTVLVYRLLISSWPYVFLVAWLGIMLLPSILSDAAPNFSRTLGASPAVFIVAAMGLSAIVVLAQRAATRLARPGLTGVGTGVVVTMLALSGWTTYRDYFDTFADAEPAYYYYDQDKLEAAQYLKREATTARVYLAPLWANQASIAFITRGAGIRSFEASHLLVFPARDAGQDAIYAFPARLDEQAGQIEATARRLGNRAVRQELRDAYGEPLLTLFRVPAAQLPTIDSRAATGAIWVMVPQNPVFAHFGEWIDFFGFDLGDRPAAGQPLSLTLYWRAVAPADKNYTVFVHLEDTAGRRVAQADGEPGDASYRTTQWSPGDVLLDERLLALPADLPPGRYTLSTGWYETTTGTRLPAYDAQGALLAEARLVLGKVEVTP